MTIEDARQYCLSMPLVTEDMPFGDDYVAFRIGGKIFAGLPLEQPNILVLKCSPDLFDEVTAAYTAIEQAWHWHKRNWMQIHLDSPTISDDLVRSLTDKAYECVFSKLKKSEQALLKQQMQDLQP